MINSDHLAVKSFALKHVDDSTDDVERAVRLYYAVRDGFRYDPYKVDLSIEGLKASRVLEDG